MFSERNDSTAGQFDGSVSQGSQFFDDDRKSITFLFSAEQTGHKTETRLALYGSSAPRTDGQEVSPETAIDMAIAPTDATKRGVIKSLVDKGVYAETTTTQRRTYDFGHRDENGQL
ncbi:hypothetical protein I350_07864 [Cryptococcus amylolentus CBS 6273]|uniref:Uncharacterized protein n=1 Tax=Cryptococcus amylolentus CBS 6273 TaxID=1296118 RepID=A0A1E3JBG5_9TREE|nr:hypothetical protein I350_07864 [Cryptococcus amylolentus CBS 6273]